MTVQLLHGDCRDVLRTLADGSVHCCITSPPYWGLRSYLPAGHPDKAREIGSEPTVHEWVRTMVEVFREVRRVLRDDGTLWLNLGDSYSTGTSAGRQDSKTASHGGWAVGSRAGGRRANVPELKPKDLIGQPWRVAFALQEDGWWLRQELIWAKRNPMPESVTDRFTKAHEQVFLLSKSERYWFDLAAVQEEASENTHQRRAGTGVGFGHGYDESPKPRYRAADALPQGVGRRQGPPGNPAENARIPSGWATGTKRSHVELDGRFRAERELAKSGSGTKNNGSFDGAMATMPAKRNPRDVRWIDEDEYLQFLRWKSEQPIAPSVLNLASEPFKGAHFATYPPSLIESFVLAGCPEGGTILDPFGGSGTTGLVADRHHRNAILIDIDERNLPMARERIHGDAPLFAEVAAA